MRFILTANCQIISWQLTPLITARTMIADQNEVALNCRCPWLKEVGGFSFRINSSYFPSFISPFPKDIPAEYKKLLNYKLLVNHRAHTTHFLHSHQEAMNSLQSAECVCMSLDGGRNPEETHSDPERVCKFHTESLWALTNRVTVKHTPQEIIIPQACNTRCILLKTLNAKMHNADMLTLQLKLQTITCEIIQKPSKLVTRHLGRLFLVQNTVQIPKNVQLSFCEKLNWRNSYLKSWHFVPQTTEMIDYNSSKSWQLYK